MSTILICSYPEDAYRLMASDSGVDVFVSKRVICDALLHHRAPEAPSG